MKEEKNSVNIPGGLNTDSPLVTQPAGTTRFVLSGVNETDEGDNNFLTNEESNEPCYTLPVHNSLFTPYTPMGKVYIGDENTLLFLAHSSGDSALAILDKECTLTVILTDELQAEKFGFSIYKQIDATFRLRRGCERVVYWVDPKPRMYIIDKPDDFKNDLGQWDVSKFNLFKKYKKIPEITDLQAIDGGGVLSPGSYNFAFQYLDEDFNPTEFVTSTETINIYGSALSSTYREIRGGTKEVLDYASFEDTNKAIKITLDKNSLDTTFPFYRIAIIEANSGSGEVSDTKFTAEISTENNVFYYTGANFESSGSQEEVTIFSTIIDQAQSIEQIENRLILGKVKGKDINYCKLQKYASKIASDVVTRSVVLSSLDNSNPKDPAMHFNGIGNMPGEIYSYGIVYIFEDRTVTPAYHIPGKGPTVPVAKIYSQAAGVYPMTNVENSCAETAYIENNSCEGDSYWGRDFEGNLLSNQPVRHHRFPLRTDYNIPFVTEVPKTEAAKYAKMITIKATKTGATVPTYCPTPPEACTPGVANFGGPGTPRMPFTIETEILEDSVVDTFSNTINPNDWAVPVGEPSVTNVSYVLNSPIILGNVVTVTKMTETFDEPTLPNEVTLSGPTLNSATGMNTYTGVSAVTGLTYTLTIGQTQSVSKESIYTGKIVGIKFSNIELPNIVDTNGHKIVGYYIVRQERTESDKTIMDSAVLLSTSKEKNFVAQGLLFPQYLSPAIENSIIKKDVLGFISPEHKFNNKKYSSFSKIVQQGKFLKGNVTKSRSKINDVAEGSGYVDGKHKGGESDIDGMSIQIKTRDNETTFVPATDFTLPLNKIKEIFYLNALEDKQVLDSEDNSADVFNLACDNTIGIMTLTENYTFPTVHSLPYVYLCRDVAEPYANFRLEPYYKSSKNPQYFAPSGTQTSEIFDGDSYINPIRYVNSIYYDTRMKQRAGRTSAWNYIAAGLLVVLAVAATIFSFGTAAAGSVALIGLAGTIAAGAITAATTLTLSGIKQDAWNKAYNTMYKQGLRKTITDEYMQNDIDPISLEARGFKKNPSDDEFQWLGDCANLWFECAINIGLRYGTTNNAADFLNAPELIENGTTYPEWNREYFGINSVGSGDARSEDGTSNMDVPPTTALDNHMVKKLTYLDGSKKSGRAYLGLAMPEVYKINKDYQRRNKQKFFSALGLEYDCCSLCVEDFPHRWHWSEQAFQEEITDNFRAFLPNNYKDLEGETGVITDIFRLKNNLYIHTEEGLWHCPQTFQERVTSDIVSFIGTGEYFSLPPRKIVDDNNSSAGNRHKWGRTKTKYGVLFPSHKESKWYLFDGEKLQPISDNGLFSEFKESMKFLVEENYFTSNKQDYPYSDNPSSPIGVGYLSTYDSKKERFIITKKDSYINMNVPYIICGNNVLTGMAALIAARQSAGWFYVGIENCLLKFRKVITTVVSTSVNVTTFHPAVKTTTVIPGCAPYISQVKVCLTGNTGIVGNIPYTYGYTNCDGVYVLLGNGTIVADERKLLTIYMENCGTWSITGTNVTVSPNADVIYNPALNCNKTITTIVPEYYTTAPVVTNVSTDTITYATETPTSVSLASVTINNSWTMSYSLKKQEWVSWHPYLPSFYFHVQEKFYAWKQGGTSIHRFNKKGSYQTFFGIYYPFIIEYVDNPNPLVSKVYDCILFQTEARKYDPTTEEFYDVRRVTFNKILFYNTQQISGILTLVDKNTDSLNYLLDQTKNTMSNLGTIILDRNERDWTVNDMRDIRTVYTVPMFRKDLASLQSQYYIDKIVNTAAISFSKDWTELESFRDKFLVVRLIFDTFADTKLTFNFSALDKKQSER